MALRDREGDLQKKWESLGISNDFIFGKVMQDENLCAELLRRIFPDIGIGSVELPEKQKAIIEGIDLRSVRLDIFTRDDQARLFDIEMETKKRAKYSFAAVMKKEG